MRIAGRREEKRIWSLERASVGPDIGVLEEASMVDGSGVYVGERRERLSMKLPC